MPYDDHEFFQGHTATMLRHSVAPEDRQAAMGQIYAYVSDLVSRKAAEPGDDLISRQLLDGTDREDVVGLAMLLLIAGHETTANMISLGALQLMNDPEQLAVLRADPGMIAPAVEEMLRYFSIGEFALSRVATSDAEIGGRLIRAGEGVIVLNHAANRDPAVFPDGDRFDIERGSRHHLAFGFGVHQCLGQNLARLELQIVFDTLFRRVPGLHPAAPIDDLPFKNDARIFGLYELPVTWDET